MTVSQNQFKHKARKRFGQNFLVDEFVIDHIVAELAPQPQETLVEIGPGKGILTDRVLPKCGHLSVIELDRDLFAMLQQRYADNPKFSGFSQDVLKFDFANITSEKIRVFGNLPYNISSPIIFHLIEQRAFISEMLFMFQREVVQRLAAKPNSKDYGRLTVMAGYWLQIEPLWEIAPDAFDPRPKVVSQLIRLTPKTEPSVQATDHAVFAELVRQAFNMRRKTIANSIRGLIDVAGIKAAGLDPSLRAEALSIDDFARLANYLVLAR